MQSSSDQRRPAISSRRQPVSAHKRAILIAFTLAPSASSASNALPRRFTSSSVRKRSRRLSVLRTAARSQGLFGTSPRLAAKLNTADRSRTTLRAAPSPPRTMTRVRGAVFSSRAVLPAVAQIPIGVLFAHTTSVVAEVQERLFNLNYNPGPINGRMDQATIAAMISAGLFESRTLLHSCSNSECVPITRQGRRTNSRTPRGTGLHMSIERRRSRNRVSQATMIAHKYNDLLRCAARPHAGLFVHGGHHVDTIPALQPASRSGRPITKR